MSNRAGLLRRPDMSARIRLLVIGTSGGTAAAVVSKALARGHRVTPHDAAIAHAATLAGHDAIVADESVAAADLRRVIDAARTAGPRRIAVITAGATPAEALLADSGLDWTVARAARLTDGGLSVRYRLAPGRLPPRPRPVSRRDVAHFLLHELERPAYLRAIVGVAR
jgi:uncharacterized protein YbjT (DUF2867 family)